MTQSIKILRSDVMTEVRKTLEYIGSHHVTEGGGNMYDIIAATPEQEEQLDRYYWEACAIVSRLVLRDNYKEYHSKTNNSLDYLSLSFELPEDFNQSILLAAKQMVSSYIVYYILYQWLLLCNVAQDKIQPYMAQCAQLIADTKKQLLSLLATSASADGSGIKATIGTNVVPTVALAKGEGIISNNPELEEEEDEDTETDD